jgi:WD40 repeat protein
LWRAGDKFILNEWHLAVAVNGVAFSPDGKYLAVALANGTVCIFRIALPPVAESR